MKPHIIDYKPQSLTLEDIRKVIKEIWEKDRELTTYDYQSDSVKREIDRIIKEDVLKDIKKNLVL